MDPNRSKIIEHSFAARGVVIVAALFVSVTVLLSGMIYVEGRVTDGVRAYVRGEGLWAKAQNDAVLYLERYSYSRDNADYLAFEHAIRTNDGDRNARQALLESPPDIEAARRSFLQGQNDAQDLNSLIWLFIYFQNVSYMQEAIGIWAVGDDRIDKLKSLGARFKREVGSGHISPAELNKLRSLLKNLNGELFGLENRFSKKLGDGARWTRSSVWKLSLGLLLVFVGGVIWISRRIIRSILDSERELFISESRFSSLKESNTIGIASWDMSGRVIEANDLLLQMLGYSRADLVAGEINWIRLTPEEFRKRDERARQELMTYGRCEPYEKSYLHKKGFRVPVYLGASMLQGSKEQGIAFIIDLTKRKKADELLQRSEHYLRTIIDTEPESVQVLNEKNELVEINRSGLAMFEADSIEAVKRHGFMNFICPEHRPAFETMNQSVLKGTNAKLEFEVTGLKGTRRWLEIHAASMQDDHGKPALVLGIARDITEQKLSEQNEAKYLRTILLLNKCNSLLVRANDEQELLLQVCRLAVKVGGYLMAWVAYARDDEHKSVIPAAQYGLDDDFLQLLKITWADEPLGWGATGTAIRTGSVSVMQNIEADLLIKPWRDAALSRGYNATIALPLFVEHKVIGALVVYSAEQNAFGEDETELLWELANDLAFGIQALRARHGKELALGALKQESEKNLALLHNASDGIHILDQEGSIIEVSDSFCEMLGYRREEMIGMNVREWDAGFENEEERRAMLRKQFLNPGRSQFETRHRCKNGHILDVEVSGHALELDGKPVLFNSSRDITERKQVLNKLHESEEKWRRLYELSPLGITLTDEEGRYVELNESFLRITGYSVDELNSTRYRDMALKRDEADDAKILSSLGKSGYYGPYEKEYIRKDGTLVPVRLNGMLVKGQDGKKYVWSIIEDISESKRITTRLEQATIQLRELIATYEATLENERKRLAREVHDELGQVLTSLHLDISALRMKLGNKNPALKKLILNMSDVTDQAINVLRNVAENLRPVAIDMGITAAIEWLCNKFSAQSGILYTFHAPRQSINLDRQRTTMLFRIVQESLTNIMRHADARNVHISLLLDGADLSMEIRDDGKGFDHEEYGERKSFGLLGMKERALLLGGDFRIVSAIDNGTSVYVRIPASQT